MHLSILAEVCAVTQGGLSLAVGGYGLSVLNFQQQRRVDVAATEDGDVARSLRQFAAMEEKRRHRDSSARLGGELRIHREPANGLPNLLFANGDNVIDKAADVGEGNVAQT